MKNNHRQIRRFPTDRAASRRAFTLVELLMVGAIIVILVALTLMVSRMVTAAAKETKTQATIQKIDTAIQQIFESYESKFSVIQNRIVNDLATSDLPEVIQQKIATHFIRDLMRMEMPQNWAEVYDSKNSNVSSEPITITLAGVNYTAEKSPLLDYYWQAYNNAEKSPSRAALLFLIIQNLNPEALEAFHGSEVADTDGDGLLEFIDAWGNPIQFLRWAPAFTGTALQPDVLALAKYVPSTDAQDWWDTRGHQLRDAMVEAKRQHPDPLDEWGAALGWFLYPLVYSVGPDGKPGIEEGDDVPPILGSDGILDPFVFPFGMPDGTQHHLDNIHNHQWYRSY